MKKSTAVVLGAAYLLVSSSLVGCAESDPDYQRVCADDATQVRVEDSVCPDPEQQGDAHSWYYIPYSQPAPGVGGKVSGGSFVKPVSAKVGSVSRGGFGGKSSSGGG